MTDSLLTVQPQTENLAAAPVPPQPDPAHRALVDALNVSFRILQAAMALVVAGFLCSGIFVVKQHETAMVLRFGSIAGTPADRILGPGLHWALPYPMSSVVRIPSGRIQSIEINDFWYYDKDSAPAEHDDGHGHQHTPKPAGRLWPALRPGIDGYLICGDVNIVHAQFVMRYQITDPYEYYTQSADIEAVARAIVRNALAKNAGSLPIDALLRTGIESFRKQVERDAQAELARIKSGISFQRLDIVRLTPPRQVQQAFDDVILAEQQYSQKINEAQGIASRLRNDADGSAARINSQAHAYKINSIEQAKADAAYLGEMVKMYKSNPEIVSFLMYQNLLQDALSAVDDKFIFNSRIDSANRQIRILLNKNPQAIR